MSERASTRRTATTAVSYVGKAVWMLRRDAESPQESLRDLTRYEATQFVWRTLSEIEMLADLILIDGYEDEWIAKDARRLADRLRARRLSEKLSNVEGRTPEEAALFRARSEKLMARTS